MKCVTIFRNTIIDHEMAFSHLPFSYEYSLYMFNRFAFTILIVALPSETCLQRPTHADQFFDFRELFGNRQSGAHDTSAIIAVT